MDHTRTVAVGVDGSAGSRAALQYALEDAARRGARLRVLAAMPPFRYRTPAYGMGSMAMGTAYTDDEILADVRAQAQRMVDELTADGGDPAGVAISVEARAGDPGDVLIDASQDVDLLVIGHRGRGGLRSALLGSVGLACVLHACCPVTIVRPVPTRAVADAVDLPAPPQPAVESQPAVEP